MRVPSLQIFTVLAVIVVIGCAPPPPPTPAISVLQSSLLIPNQAGGYYFGVVISDGNDGSISAPITFEIENSGAVDLSVSLTLTDPGSDFDLISMPSATIPPATTSSFVIQFDPLTAGVKSAQITIDNNDPSANPYTIQVSGTGDPGSGTGSIQGTVVDSVGGAPVSGTSVSIEGTAHATTTDANGEFTLSGINPGTYSVLAAKSGMAGSRLQGIDILSNDTLTVSMVQTIYSFSAAKTTPPTLTVRGIFKDGVYTASVPISVSAEAGSPDTPLIGTYDHPGIMLKINSKAGVTMTSSSVTQTLSYAWNSADYPPGGINIKIVAYDNNNNRCELNVPVTVGARAGSPPNHAPSNTYSDYEINAITSGRSFSIFNSEPLIIQTDNGERLIKSDSPYSIMSAEPDSTVMVDFLVDAYTDTKGINVYRSSVTGGPYTLAGGTTSVINVSWRPYSCYNFVDASAELVPGSTYYYRLTYFNGYGESAMSTERSVRILPKYNLNLASPANYATTTDETPTLSWTSGAIAGATRTDTLYVWDALTADLAYTYTFSSGETSRTTSALPSGKVYEWNVVSQYYYSNYYHDSYCYVYSRSLPGTGNFATNGAYYFTVVQP